MTRASFRRLARWLPAAVVAAALLAACSDKLFTPPAPGERAAPLSLSLHADAAAQLPSDAFDKADSVHVRLSRSSGIALDTTLALPAPGEQRVVQLPVTLQQETETFTLVVEMLEGHAVLFRATSTVELHRGQTATADVPLDPVIGALLAPDSLPTLTAIGGTATVTAAAVFASGDTLDGAPIHWASADTGIVAVSDDGHVVARGEGATTLTATYGELSATVRVQVHAAVTKVEILPPSLSLGVDSTASLAATARDANGHTLVRTIAWTSSDTSVATVDGAGTVTGVSGGAATITATADGVSATAPVRVIPRAVATVAVAPATATLLPGDTVRFTATVADAEGRVLEGRAVSWTTSDAAVASVDSTGLVRALAPGSADVVASADGKTGSARVTVGAPAIGVDTSAAVLVAEAFQPSPNPVVRAISNAGVGTLSGLSVAVEDSAGNAVPWLRATLSATSAPAVLTLTGTAASLPPGTYTARVVISSSLPGVAPRTIPVSLRVVSGVDSVVLLPDTATLFVGDSIQLSATAFQADTIVARTFAWTSSDPTTVRVDPSGLATAIAPGTATITASTGGRSASVTITVPTDGVGVDVEPSESNLAVGETLQLHATLWMSEGDSIPGQHPTWQSSDPSIATVGPTGIVTGISAGNVLITATIRGLEASAYVFVEESYSDIAAGTFAAQTCATRSAGTAVCWGFANIGQTQTLTPLPTEVPGGLHFVTAQGGSNFACGIVSGGAAYCWGSNDQGQLGDGSASGYAPSPVAVAGGHSFASISLGAEFACGLTTDDHVFCWGRNDRGQLGDSTTTASNVPVPIRSGETFSSVSAGGYHACAVGTGNEAYCWGSNGYYQLASDSISESLTPRLVSSTIAFKAVSAGGNTTCGVDLGGAIYCWGRALGVSDQNSTPTVLSTPNTFQSVSVDSASACGLTIVGQAFCWGANSEGQLGNDSYSDSATPVAVAYGILFQKLAVGGAHACGLSYGAIYCWGDNLSDELGIDYDISNSPVPIFVDGPSYESSAGNRRPRIHSGAPPGAARPRDRRSGANAHH